MADSKTDVPRALVAEALGTALLMAVTIGSGFMAARLSGGNAGLELLASSLATGAALTALILAFGGISGAHLNPAVTLADASQGGLSWRLVPGYLAAQVAGALAGTAAANVMFGAGAVTLSTNARSGAGVLFGEFVATFGLLAVVWGCARRRSEAVPFAVGAYVVSVFWFTSSTGFANPAGTLARMITPAAGGIRPVDAPAFVVVELAGAALATGLFRWLVPALPKVAPDVVVPHPEGATPASREARPRS